MTFKKKLYLYMLSIVFIMAIVILLMLLTEHQAITSLDMSLKSYRHLNLLNASYKQHQTAFNLYVNARDRKRRDDCAPLSEEMLTQSKAILEDFPDNENAQLLYTLVISYTEQADAILQISDILSYDEILNGINSLDKLITQINQTLDSINMLYLDNIVTHSQNSMELWNSQYQLAIITFVILIIVLLLALGRILQNITSPIMKLVYYAKRICAGDYSYHFEMPDDMNKDELSLLTGTFARMSEAIARQMKELQEKITLTEKLHQLEIQNVSYQLALAEREMDLMQSIINPHFLFNCLGTVTSMAILENASQTQNIASRIAKYLRSSIELTGTRITIREEVELLRQYTYIQSLRFGNRISVFISCSANSYDALVPAMFTQPLVENAYVHGLRTVLQNGRIDVTINTRPDHQLGIRISDNGNGIPEEKLKEINNAINQSFQNNQKYIGLHSVISQLRNFYQNDYSFEIQSLPDKGTIVLIRIPFLSAENNQALPQMNPTIATSSH